MKILAIETSNEVCGAALFDDDRIISEKNVLFPKYSSSEIFNLINKVYKKGRIDCVAVDIGPGSFTGIRIGVSLARAYGQFLKIPVIGISGLDCFVYKYNSEHLKNRKICYPIIDALREEVYTAEYSGLERKGEYKIIKIEELKEKLNKNCVVIGNSAICSKFNLGKICIKTQLSALLVGRTARMEIGKGLIKSYKDIYPLYIRKSFAEEKIEHRK